jgi:hypothetical protein
VVRTAEVAGLNGVVFVRGKHPDADVVALGEELDLPLLITPLSLFDACGILYEQGMRGFSLSEAKRAP